MDVGVLGPLTVVVGGDEPHLARQERAVPARAGVTIARHDGAVTVDDAARRALEILANPDTGGTTCPPSPAPITPP